MPGRQKSGAEAPMDRGGGPASSPKQGLARRRKQMSRGRRKGIRGTPLEKRYVAWRIRREQEKRQSPTIQFETCSGSCARANGKISLDKAIKTIQKGLTGGVPLSNR